MHGTCNTNAMKARVMSVLTKGNCLVSFPDCMGLLSPYFCIDCKHKRLLMINRTDMVVSYLQLQPMANVYVILKTQGINFHRL